MKKFLLIAGAAAVLAGCAKNGGEDSQSFVEVTGNAEKEVQPDVFYLNFTLSENNSAKTNISSLEKKILESFKSLNINTEKDLNVTNMYGDNWNWWRRGKIVYQSKSYSLKINDLSLLNKVCDKLDSLGYNEYYLGKTEYSKAEELKAEIQQEAVRKARMKAENLLAGEGKKVGELLYIREQNAHNDFPVYDYNKNAFDMAAESAEPPVNFRKIKIAYDVTVRYSIK